MELIHIPPFGTATKSYIALEEPERPRGCGSIASRKSLRENTMGTTVLYERQGIIGYIVLNRPHVLNAMNDEWLSDLLAMAERARTDNEVRVIVVRGEGRAFCAGADLKESVVHRELAVYRDHHMRPQQDIARMFRRMGKPVIAQVHG